MDKIIKNHSLINLLLIGFGPHAKRIYYPISVKDGIKNNFRIIHAVDLDIKREDLEKYFSTNKYPKIDILYLQKGEYGTHSLKSSVVKELNKIVSEKNISGVIISTEPLSHFCYAEWALKKGLSILMDKPISTAINATTSIYSINQIKKDYYLLKDLYIKAKAKHPKIVFNLMAQRRYHPAFNKIVDLISEVRNMTNCPITSIQSFHSDGQWRLPNEIVDIGYHSYNQGYGKCSHSGYHSMDIVPWLIQKSFTKDKYFDNFDIYSSFSRPSDFVEQINLRDYQKLFKNFHKYNKYSKKQLDNLYKTSGEIDCFLSLAFKKSNKVMTLASINLLHNGFSQRGNLYPNMEDLYKGNGRLRQESHYICQGPFQAISFISYQSQEVNPDKNKDIYDVGGEYHLDINVFRNNSLFPKWKSYEKFNIKNFSKINMLGKSRGHQEDARRSCLLEFINQIGSCVITNPISDYLDHEISTLLLYGAYKSSLLKSRNKNPLVNIQILFNKCY